MIFGYCLRALDPGAWHAPLRDDSTRRSRRTHLWRGGRVVERAGLEIRFSRKVNVGSNPTLSAIRLALLAHGYAMGTKRGECPERNAVESKGSDRPTDRFDPDIRFE